MNPSFSVHGGSFSSRKQVDPVSLVHDTSFWCVYQWHLFDLPHNTFQTAKAVYIVVATLHQGQTVLTVDRKLPLITIKTIAMSTLRDDWFVRRTAGASCMGICLPHTHTLPF